MSPEEAAAIALAIMDEVNYMTTNGADPAIVTRELARAQVFATLAAAPKPSTTHIAVREAISAALEAAGAPVGTEDAWEAAEAVMRLL